MLFKSRKKQQEEAEKPENPAYQTITIDVEKEDQRMDPKQFMLWGFLGTVTLLFTGLLMAHVLLFAREQAAAAFSIPWEFYLSTGLILGSSYTLHQSARAVKLDEILQIRPALLVTLGLGAAFLLCQAMGWYQLFQLDVSLSQNPALGFIYIISGIHALHILGGLIYLLRIVWLNARFELHSRNQKPMINCTTYWHFVDGLWIYVFLVLLLF